MPSHAQKDPPFLFRCVCFMKMGALPARVCAWGLRMLEEDIGPPGTGVWDVCEPPHGCWDLTLGPCQHQQTVPTMSHF